METALHELCGLPRYRGRAKIGPTLSGIGKMSVEAITHNILTPNAKMESGYYTHEVITKDGIKYSEPSTKTITL